MFHAQTSRLFLCHPACVHQEDCRLSLASHLASRDVLTSAPSTFTHKSTHLSRRACKCTTDFHSQSPLKIVLASAPLTFTHKSLLPLGKACHSGTVLFLWCSHLALVSLILPLCTTNSVHRTPTVGLISLVAQYLLRYCNTSSGTGLHSTLSYLVCGASSCSNKLVLGTGCHLNKINSLLFPLTVLRSLSFLIPSFTKKHLSSYPVVRLPLTNA